MEFFSSSPRPYGFWGSLSLLFVGYRGLIPPRVKLTRREADHSPPSSAEVKNACSFTQLEGVLK
jgi:hypothetical protein